MFLVITIQQYIIILSAESSKVLIELSDMERTRIKKVGFMGDL